MTRSKAKVESKFVVPTVQEVIDYIVTKKPEWPKNFSKWYAEKFWNAYEASGWKLSAGRGGLVKNWRACFNNNWQTLKYTEDLKMLERLTPKPKPIDPATLDWMSAVLEWYRKDPDAVPDPRLASCYEFLKEQGFLKKLTEEQRQEGVLLSATDLMKARALMTKHFLKYMVDNLLTFDYFFNAVP